MAITREVDAAKPSREARHVDLYHALTRLRDVQRHVDALHEQIAGPQPKPDGPEQGQVEKAPTLAEMLVRAPNAIHSMCDNIDDTLRAIEEALF